MVEEVFRNRVTNPRGHRTVGEVLVEGWPLVDPYFLDEDLNAARVSWSDPGWEVVGDSSGNYFRGTSEGYLRFWPDAAGAGWGRYFGRAPQTDVTFRCEVRVVGDGGLGVSFRAGRFLWSDESSGDGSQIGYNNSVSTEVDGWRTYTVTRGVGSYEQYDSPYVSVGFEVTDLPPGAEVHVRNPGVMHTPTQPHTDPDLSYDWLNDSTVAGLIGPVPTGWTVNDGGVLYYSQSRDALALRIVGSTGWDTMTGTPQGPSTSEPATYLTHIVDSTADASLNIGTQGASPTASDPLSIPAGGGVMRWHREEGVSTGTNFRPIRFPNASAAADVIGETFYFRALLVEGEYDGDWFDGDTPNTREPSGFGWVYSWEGTPGGSASTKSWERMGVSLAQVVEVDAPAVGIFVTGLATGSRVTVWREVPGHSRQAVQGLTNVDVDGAGYWVDYLPPLGVPVTYVVEVLEGDPLEENSATITIPSSTAWLQDALNPLLAVEVACRPGNRDTLFFTAEAFTAFERPTNSDLVSIMGGRVPVGMTSRRQTPVGIPFNMVTTAAEASSLLREVLIEGTHLVLRVPPEISMLDPVTYLSDVQVSEEPSRQSFLGGHVIRWNMTGSQTRGPRIMAWTALWTYDDVAELYAGYSYTDLVDGRRYVDWQARPDEAQLAGFSTTSGGSNA